MPDQPPSAEPTTEPRKTITSPAREGDILSLDLDLLDDNPFQPRTSMDPAKLEELAASIAQSGLLQPIAVRPVAPGRYQVVGGGRRTAAFRMLLAAAKTESERRQYALIRAHVVTAKTDMAMAVAGYVENAVRDGLNPVEEAVALARIRQLGANLSATEVANLTCQPERRVRRLLRLYDAPQAVKDSVTTGLLVELNEPGEPGPKRGGAEGAAVGSPPAPSAMRRERRRLELIPALEFSRFHEHCRRTKAATADARTATAVERALREGWGLRRIRAWVDAAVNRGKETDEAIPGEAVPSQAVESPATSGPQASAEAGRETPATSNETKPAAVREPLPLTNTTAARFLLHLARLSAATAEQLRAARSALETMLDAVDDHLRRHPEGGAGA